MPAPAQNINWEVYVYGLLQRYDWVIIGIVSVYLLRLAAGEDNFISNMASEFKNIIKLMKSMKALNALITIALAVVILALLGPGRFAEFGAFHETNMDQDRLQAGQCAFAIVFLGAISLISLRLCKHEP